MITTFSYKDRLANSQADVLQTIEIVWSAYRSVLSKEGQVAYVSVPITSGLEVYKTCAEMGISSIDEIKRQHPEKMGALIKSSIAIGNQIAMQVASEVEHPVIAPSIFEARKQRWSQSEYMAMWLRMIEENVGVMYMTPGWEFSNGCAEEYLHAVLMAMGWRERQNISIFDVQGHGIPLHVGVEALANALEKIHAYGLKASALAKVFRTLCAVSFIQCDLSSYDLLPNVRDYAFMQSTDFRKVKATAKEVAPLLRSDYELELAGFVLEDGQHAHRSDVVPENILLRLCEEKEVGD